MKRILLILLPVLLLFFSTEIIYSQDGASLVEPSPEPKDVQITFLLLDILKIDDVNKRMSVDFAIRMTWKDVSLNDINETFHLEQNNELWHPELQFLNSINLEPKMNEIINVKNGTVTYAQRYIGDVSINANFSDFPFDEHEFKIKVVAVNIDSFTFVINQAKSTFVKPNLTLSEWDVKEFNLSIMPFNTQVRYLPGFEFKMEFKRKIQFYIWKTVIPLTLVIFMSWTVFWVHPKHLEAQIAITVTSMLTMVTFQFLLSNILPPLSYLTKMDIFVFGANFIVFLTLIETIISSYYNDRNELEMAELIDKRSRIIFPILLIVTYVAAVAW